MSSADDANPDRRKGEAEQPTPAASPPGGEDAAPVGYGRPPPEHRFKKDQSGNIKGRPTGARGLKAEAAEVLNETFPVNGSRKRVTARKAMLLKQREKAIKHGDTRAASLLLGFAQAAEEEQLARASEAERQALDEQDDALIEAALRRLAPAKPSAGESR